jgi:putative hydrolase of the HAD superfamily
VRELADFLNTETWIFDLDNTLYPAESKVFTQIDKRMNEFIAVTIGMSMEEAAGLRRNYYLEYGTTLAGLMRNYGSDPHKFLDYVHDVDLSPIEEAPELRQALASLPGRKFIFTNGSRRHAERVAERLGVSEHFDDVFDIAAAEFTPKPTLEAYERFLERLDVRPRSAAMFEDLPANLEKPHFLGMRTVLVTVKGPDHPAAEETARWERPPEHIHHVTDDLTMFLTDVLDWIGAPAKNAKPIDNGAAHVPKTVNLGSGKQS